MSSTHWTVSAGRGYPNLHSGYPTYDHDQMHSGVWHQGCGNHDGLHSHASVPLLQASVAEQIISLQNDLSKALLSLEHKDTVETVAQSSNSS